MAKKKNLLQNIIKRTNHEGEIILTKILSSAGING